MTSEHRDGLDDEAGARARIDRPIVARGAPHPNEVGEPIEEASPGGVVFRARIVKRLRGAGVRIE
jgi:hypothetical protein